MISHISEIWVFLSPFKLGSHISILYIFHIPYFKSHISEIWLSNCDLIFQYPIPPLSFLSVTKFWTTFPLTVFLKHGQLDFYKASSSISDYLTLIFPSNFWRTEIWVGNTFKSICIDALWSIVATKVIFVYNFIVPLNFWRDMTWQDLFQM